MNKKYIDLLGKVVYKERQGKVTCIHTYYKFFGKMANGYIIYIFFFILVHSFAIIVKPFTKDVAYALTTTLCGDELDNMDDLVDHYILCLKVGPYIGRSII